MTLESLEQSVRIVRGEARLLSKVAGHLALRCAGLEMTLNKLTSKWARLSRVPLESDLQTSGLSRRKRSVKKWHGVTSSSRTRAVASR